VQVITNNAFNCESMGDLIMRDYLSIVWTPCVTHYLNILIKDKVAKLPWVKDIVNKAKHVVNFVTKKPILAIYMTF
jgi:hypothetical protein